MTTEASPIQYDLTQGIYLNRLRFDDGGVVEIKNVPEFVSPAVFPSFTSSDDRILEQTTSEINHGYMGGKKAFQQVHYVVLNQKAETDNITVLGMNWGAYTRNDHAKRELAYLVRENPDKRFLVYDNPHMGLSENMPRETAIDIAKSGRFTKMAGHILKGIGSALDDYEQVDFAGRSQGGLVVLEMAAQHDKTPIGTVLVHDAPGSRQMTPSELYDRFVRKEGAHAAAYVEAASLDMTGVEHQRQTNSMKSLARSVARLTLRGGLLTQFVQLPTGFMQGKLQESIAAALPNVKEKLCYISPAYSELNRPEDVFMALAWAVHDAEPSCEVEQVIYNGTHAFAQGTPAAAVALEKQALAA
jgi:pimeloyl-ACP methyl ester carboxylesterase